MRDDLTGALIFSWLKKMQHDFGKQNCIDVTDLAHSILRYLAGPEGLLSIGFQICVTDMWVHSPSIG